MHLGPDHAHHAWTKIVRPRFWAKVAVQSWSWSWACTCTRRVSGSRVIQVLLALSCLRYFCWPASLLPFQASKFQASKLCFCNQPSMASFQVTGTVQVREGQATLTLGPCGAPDVNITMVPQGPCPCASNSKVGSATLKAQIRSAQYEYWHMGQDLWQLTGSLFQWELEKFVLSAWYICFSTGGKDCHWSLLPCEEPPFCL